jgi:hypothetical protein
MVPKKGLEPPHPCGYMDLNHARLPIPPLRRQILWAATPGIARQERIETHILQGYCKLSNRPSRRGITVSVSDWRTNRALTAL